MSSPDTAVDEGHGPTAAVFAVAAGFFAWTCLQSPQWYDSAEFAATAWRLSTSHSPGHPLHAMVARAFQLLPLGDGVFRANLASGLCAGAALAGIYRLLRALAPDLGVLPTMALSLMPAVMPVVWLQSVRAEVYALQLLMTVALAAGCRRVARGGDVRALAALALTFGLAGANHSYLGLLMIPLALWAMAVGERRLRAVGLAAAAGLLGLTLYAFLALRAHGGAEIGWGAPATASELWQMISAQEWQRSMRMGQDFDLIDNAGILAAWVTGQIGGPAAALGLALIAAGMPALVRERAWPALALLVVIALPLLTRVVYPLDLANPDLGGYLLPSLVGLCALVGVAAARLGPARWLVLALPIATAPGFDSGDRQGSHTAERFARAVLDEVPPDGVLLTSDYATTFLSWALRSIEGARPDVALVFRGQMDRRWFAERLERHLPARAAQLGTGFMGPEARYEVGVELGRLGTLARDLRPTGLMLGLGVEVDDAAVRSAFAALGPPSDVDAARSRAFLHLQSALHLGRAHLRPALARWHLDRATELAGDDPYLLEVRALLEGS